MFLLVLPLKKMKLVILLFLVVASSASLVVSDLKYDQLTPSQTHRITIGANSYTTIKVPMTSGYIYNFVITSFATNNRILLDAYVGRNDPPTPPDDYDRFMSITYGTNLFMEAVQSPSDYYLSIYNPSRAEQVSLDVVLILDGKVPEHQWYW